MQTFAQLKTGDTFALNTATRPDSDWVEVRVEKYPNVKTIALHFATPAKNGQTSAVFTEADYDWHVKNGQILPLEIDPEEALILTRATLDAAKATIARQEARIAELEAENATLSERITLLETRKEADADAETIRRLARYQRRAEMCAWGPEDAEEGGQ